MKKVASRCAVYREIWIVSPPGERVLSGYRCNFVPLGRAHACMQYLTRASHKRPNFDFDSRDFTALQRAWEGISVCPRDVTRNSRVLCGSSMPLLPTLPYVFSKSLHHPPLLPEDRVILVYPLLSNESPLRRLEGIRYQRAMEVSNWFCFIHHDRWKIFNSDNKNWIARNRFGKKKGGFEMIRLPLIWANVTSTRLNFENT